MLTYKQKEYQINGVDVIIFISYDDEKPLQSTFVEKIIPRSPDADLWDILTREQQNKIVQRMQNITQEESKKENS